MGQDFRTTYYKRLGWPWTGDPLDQRCKKCGDSSLHTIQGWYTKNCKPVMIPDQWDTLGYGDYKRLPDNIADEDITLMKPWDEREELKDYPPNGR